MRDAAKLCSNLVQESGRIFRPVRSAAMSSRPNLVSFLREEGAASAPDSAGVWQRGIWELIVLSEHSKLRQKNT